MTPTPTLEQIIVERNDAIELVALVAELDRRPGIIAIARALAARDPGNAGWARDVVVTLAKMAEADTAQAAAYWREAADHVAAMEARGVLAPRDRWLLEETRRRLAEAEGR